MKLLRAFCLFSSLLLTSLAFANTSNQGAASALADKNILVIYSYHPTFPTASQVYDGLRSVLPIDSGVQIDLEYMDTKRHYSPEGLKEFFDHIQFKLNTRPDYDLIITADDNALSFVLEHQKTLFADLPIVFLGVNSRTLALAQNVNPLVTGVIEHTSMLETIDTIEQLRPEMQNLYVISDSTPSGLADLQTFLTLESELQNLSVQQLNLSNLSWAGLAQSLSELDPTDSVLLLSAYVDNANERKTFEDGLALIINNSTVPVFHLWEHGIGDGLAGGVIISHREQGVAAARIARDIFLGKSVDTIPVVDRSPNIAVFDSRVLEKFQIKKNALPDGSELRFESISFYQRYQQVVIVATIVFVFLIFIILGLSVQIQQREKLSQRVRESEGKLRTILDNLDASVFMKNTQGEYQFANRKVRELFGARLDEIVGKTDDAFFDETTSERISLVDEQVIISGKEYRAEETNVLQGSHEIRTYMSTKLPLKDEQQETYGLCGISVDITERKNHERQLERLAHFDQLTGLPNRIVFSDRLQQAMAECDRSDQTISIMYLDLDGFKEVNDTYGHEFGDDLLKAFSVRTRGVVRNSDTLARLGGDEFVVLLHNEKPIDGDIQFANRLLESIARPLNVQGKQIQVEASIGITRYPQDSPVDADQLVRQADQAMYIAKTQGRNRFHFFNPDNERQAMAQIELINKVHSGLKQGEFELHLQPQIDLTLGKVIGAEALIRWNDPERGLVMPFHFLPFIENDDVISEVDQWVIKTALKQLNTWKKEKIDLTLSINLSHKSIGNEYFVSELASILRANPDAPVHKLKLEVLESRALDDLEAASKNIYTCRQLGVSFSLDDFGTGYSSLSYLKQLPVDEIKVDRSFVKDMLINADDRAILAGIKGLGDAFQLGIMVEGTETLEHACELKKMGFTKLQGYAFAQPMPSAVFFEWWSKWNLPPELQD